MGAGKKWEGAVKWHKISFRGDENALKLIVVMTVTTLKAVESNILGGWIV